MFKRYSRAERDLKQARPIGEGAKMFYKAINIKPIKSPDSNELLVAMTSDQGSKFKKKKYRVVKLKITLLIIIEYSKVFPAFTQR